MSSRYPILDNRPIDQWKVAELKEELKRRKLGTKGLKEELVRRLHESILEESEVDNGLNSDSIQRDVNSDDQEDPDTAGDAQLENDSLELTVEDDKQSDEKPAKDVDAISNPDVEMVDQNHQIDDQVIGVGQDVKQADGDIPILENDGAFTATYENDGCNENPTITDDLMVTAEEAIPSESIVQNDGESIPPSQSEPSTQDSFHEPKSEDPEIPNEGASDLSEPRNQISEVKHDPSGISPHADLESHSQDLMPDEPNNTEPHSEDALLEQVEHNNQVSEVEPNLGFQVSSELISSDSVSINKKNELKDNLNANDFPLEIEVIKPEMVHSSSSDVDPVGGELQPLDTAGLDLAPPEEIDVSINAKEGSPEKKVDTTDAGYPEKLNLDRSSGEESMEEDVLETKNIESHAKPDEAEDANVDPELHEKGSHMEEVGASIPLIEDNILKEESLPSTNAEKRKLEASDTIRINEPSKRQRRWNAEPLKVPEHPPVLTTTGTPKTSIDSTPKRSFMRSDSVVSGDSPKERVVPPSQRSATTSLRIDRFLRPFTLKQVREFLGKTGTLCDFWMDTIKTHCYVTYSSEEEAIATRNAVYNIQWPVNGGRLLVAEFVDPQEVKSRSEAPPEPPVPISPTPKTPIAPPQMQQPFQLPVRQFGHKQQLPPPPPLPSPPALGDAPLLRERQQLPPPPRKKLDAPKHEPPSLTLDDLFKKTKATPRIYYLPLSEEEVAAKRATPAKVTGE